MLTFGEKKRRRGLHVCLGYFCHFIAPFDVPVPAVCGVLTPQILSTQFFCTAVPMHFLPLDDKRIFKSKKKKKKKVFSLDPMSGNASQYRKVKA